MKLTVQERQSCSKIDQHIFEKNWFTLKQMNSIPKPSHYSDDEREEYCLQRDPDFSEASVLIDNSQVKIHDVANVLVHLEISVNGNANIKQVEVVVQ